jgi:hypothetical protein
MDKIFEENAWILPQHLCTQYLFPRPLIKALYIPFMYLLSIYDSSQFQIARTLVNMQLTYSKVFFSNVSFKMQWNTLFCLDEALA